MKIRCLIEIEIDNESEEFDQILRSISLQRNHTLLPNVQFLSFIPFTFKGLLHRVRNVIDDSVVNIDRKLGMFGTQESRTKLNEEYSSEELED